MFGKKMSKNPLKSIRDKVNKASKPKMPPKKPGMGGRMKGLFGGGKSGY